MARPTGAEKSKRATREVSNAPSVLDRVNPDEINIKVINLVATLRGPEDENITETMALDEALGERPLTEGAILINRMEAEADFLGSYLSGVIFIYEEYFGRLGIELGSGDLSEVWAKGIEPRWKGMLQRLEDDFNRDYPGEEPSLLQHQVTEFKKRAALILEREYNHWREKVEEAVSDERFGQGNSEIASAGRPRQKSDHTAVSPLIVPPGATWENLRITMSEHALHVELKGKTEDRAFQEAGFEEKRRKQVPDRLWHVLQVLALLGGVLPFDDPNLDQKARLNIKQYVSQLRKRLKALFPIEGDPFEPTGKTRKYRSRFKISSREGLRFPTPGGTTWDKVAIEEVQSGCIRFSVETLERFSAFSDGDEEVGRPETALHEGQIEREHDLQTLQLVAADGSPDPRGSALLAVLRARGKVERHSSDKAMLSLGEFLCDFMQIRESPFQFSEHKGEWCAAFDASSTVARDPG